MAGSWRGVWKSLPCQHPLDKLRGGVGRYLESYDNVSSWPVTTRESFTPLCEVNPWLDNTCEKEGVGWFIVGECANGHRFAKELVCGKEFCSVCGEDDSIAHNRRFVRWLPKVQEIEVLGYFVFTIPEALRAKYKTKVSLSRLGHQVQEILKSWGYLRGLRRWHWFGDITKYGLRGEVVFHPHLNCLVDGQGGGFLSPRALAAIKLEYAGLVYGIPVKDLGESHPIDVHYHYRLSPGKMVHTLKYVTRATFRNYTWDLEMAMELRGFRNMVVWGRGQWDDEPAWSLGDLGDKAREVVDELDIRAIESIVAGVCPVCGEALTWGEALPIGLLDMVDKQSLGAGYYSLGDLPPPPVQPADVKFRLYALELAHRVEVRQSVARAEAEARAEAGEYQGWWSGLLDTD